MSTSAPTNPAKALRPAIVGIAVLVLVFVGAGGVAFAMLRGTGDASSTELARLVPADTQVFASLDLDLTSDSWRNVGDLLETLEVRDDATRGRDDALDEEGIDYDEDIAPVLAETVAAAVALTLNDDPLEDPLVVGLIETRDVPGLLELIGLLSEAGNRDGYARDDSRDDALGLDVRAFTAESGDEGEDFVLASGDGIVYFAADLGHIRRLVREAEAAPLSEVAAFRDLQAAAAGGLAFTYVDVGSLFDAFEEVLLEEPGLAEAFTGDANLAEQLTNAFDEVPAHWATTLVASGDGFSSELLWLFDPDDPAYVLVAEVGPPDLDRAVAATPRDALLFATGAGLGATIQSAIDTVREDQPREVLDQLDEALDLFREEAGLDLEEDLLAQFVGTFAFSFGWQEIGEGEPDFALFLSDAADDEVLQDHLRELRRLGEQACACESNVGIGWHAGFQYAGWPEDGLDRFMDGESLATSANFEVTRGLLHDNPLSLLYVDLGAIFDAAIEQGELDLDEWNAAALRGLGLSANVDGNVGRLRFVIPISDPDGSE